MAGAPSKMALATGRDFCEDGVGDEEESYMPSSSSESSFAGDNLNEAEQVPAAQLTKGGSTLMVTRSMWLAGQAGHRLGDGRGGRPQYPQTTPMWKPWGTI